MKTLIIPQKMSGTGSIHDLESQYAVREIKFKEGEKFAIVLAAYYGQYSMYSTHRFERTAAKQSKKDFRFSHRILGVDGKEYEARDGSLIAIGEHGYSIS